MFNGKSIFEREDLVGVVFDDAHTAHGIIRDQFTIRLDRRQFSTLYDEITQLTQLHFRNTGRGMLFEEVVNRRDIGTVLFVPTFVSAPLADRLVALLQEHGVSEKRQTMFAWNHLRTHIGDCTVLIHARRIEITPLLPPVNELRPFQDDVRRLYLSATLPADDDFCRTFGRYPAKTIEPGGRAGETERMILIARQEATDEEAVEWVKELVQERKTLIMVPYGEAADRWTDIAAVFRSEEGHARIRRFAESADEKLVFVARYDGVDLPGEECRMLVIYGLPVGATLMERFFEFHLRASGATDSLIASRLVQMLGRIGRGMADYGVVLILGQQLVKWILAPGHLALLPPHVRRQLELGLILRDNEAEFPTLELVPSCLDREDDWRELYEQYMHGKDDGSGTGTDPHGGGGEAKEPRLPVIEHRFLKLLWDGRHEEAARVLGRHLNLAFRASRRLGAWYTHWQAHALAIAGHPEEAESRYREAGKLSGELGRLPLRGANPRVEEQIETGEQANAMAEELLGGRQTIVQKLQNAGQALGDPNASAAQHEEAVRIVGSALAFDASRPDNDHKQGPDVLWITPSKDRAFVFELKTKKGAETEYNRRDIGQLHQHIQWTTDRFPATQQLPIFVGPRRSASRNASPPDDVWVAALSEVLTLSEVLVEVYERALAQSTPLFRPSEIQAAIDEHCLAWSEIEGRLELVPLAQL